MHPITRLSYNCTPLEPQGILSFCTMILLVFIGVQVGRFVRFVRSDLRTILRMLLMAVVMVAAGLGLSGVRHPALCRAACMSLCAWVCVFVYIYVCVCLLTFL